MIEITFTGETLQDLAAQAAQFAATVGGTQPADKPAKRGGKKATEEKPADNAEPEEKSQPEAEAPKPDAKKLEKIKEEALDVLRKVYGKGENGVLQVRNILRIYGVKKAGDVPVSRAEELLVSANAAFKLVTEDDAEDAPI